MKSLQERFAEKVVPCPTTGCFLWDGATRSGYGRIYTGNNENGNPKPEQANRVAYELSFGSIPEGMEVCHSCDNPSCVNPLHLFLGTHKDNMDDRDRKGRTIAGQSNKTHCPRGHEYAGDNVYIHNGSRKCKACSAIRQAAYKERLKAKENQ